MLSPCKLSQYVETYRPLAQRFIGSQIRRQNSKLMQMLNSNTISDIHIVMADCYKQLDGIIQKRLSANALKERE